MDTSELDHYAALREWSRGSNPLSAATELLIRSGFAQDWHPWIHPAFDGDRAWIDFDAIPQLSGGMSGGERRLLTIAASLGGGVEINLSDEISGLDLRATALVATAIVHAAGFTTPTTDIVLGGEDGETPSLVTRPPLASWPDS